MYKNISQNKRLTFLLITLFLVFIIGVGYLFATIYNSPGILVIAVIVATVQALVSYYYSDQIALSTTGAQPAPRKEFLELHRIVENLSIAAGLPKPKIYVINDPSPNAFATGRNPKNASLAVTTGLLEKMDKSELEGVIAHELSHVGNWDILVMTVVVVLVGVVALVADWGLRMAFWRGNDRENNNGGAYLLLIALALWILAPISATLIQLAVSRRREYLADASGALLTRYPEGLASALDKIDHDRDRTNLKNRATAHLFISSPLKEDREKNDSESWFMTIFSTHPPIAERIKRLRAMIQ